MLQISNVHPISPFLTHHLQINVCPLYPSTYVFSDLNGEEITGTFFGKVLQKTNQNEFRVEKVIKRKGNKSFVKWKRYDNSFNSWIDRKDIV